MTALPARRTRIRSVLERLRPATLALLLSLLAPLAAIAQNLPAALVISHGGDGAALAEDLEDATFERIDWLDGFAGVVTLDTLTPYDSVLVYTNNAPIFPEPLGDALADYVDFGGNVVIATYGFSTSFAIAGRIMDPGYAPLTDSGNTGAVTGSVSAVLASDPIFQGVDASNISFFHNGNYAIPDLDAGAVLLADDGGAPVRMIARRADRRVLSINIYPDAETLSEDGKQLFRNALRRTKHPKPAPALGSGAAIVTVLAMILGAIVLGPAEFVGRSRSSGPHRG